MNPLHMNHILIVDDDADIRLILCDALRDAGYSCIAAENSFDALRELETFRIDLIITDLNMPGMDGLQLIETVLKRRHTTNSPPFILLTGDLTQAVQQRAQQAGAFATLTKPFSPMKLRQTIAAAYENMKLYHSSHQTRSSEEMSR